MWQKIKTMIPRHTLIYLLVCLSGLLIIVFAGIIPNYISLAGLDRKIISVQFQLEEQNNLYPIYQLLKNRSQHKALMVLPFPARNRLSREVINLFPTTFKDIAKKAGMGAISISPDLNSLTDDSKFLIVNAVIRGDFFNFRKLLIGLGEVPYLERVEEIQVQQNQDIMEFKMKIRLALA